MFFLSFFRSFSRSLFLKNNNNRKTLFFLLLLSPLRQRPGAHAARCTGARPDQRRLRRDAVDVPRRVRRRRCLAGALLPQESRGRCFFFLGLAAAVVCHRQGDRGLASLLCSGAEGKFCWFWLAFRLRGSRRGLCDERRKGERKRFFFSPSSFSLSFLPFSLPSPSLGFSQNKQTTTIQQ